MRVGSLQAIIYCCNKALIDKLNDDEMTIDKGHMKLHAGNLVIAIEALEFTSQVILTFFVDLSQIKL